MRTLPLRVEAEFYRIAQEALTNAIRHAQATDIALALKVNGAAARLVVHDNGCGFDTRRVPANRHGIVGMRERARLLGGSLRIESRQGRGTTVSAVAALPEEETP
jgi:signal transduction histidine kinase